MLSGLDFATLATTLLDINKSSHKEDLVEVAVYKEPLVDEAPVKEAVIEDVNKKLTGKEHISVSEEPVPLCVKSELVCQVPGITGFD